MDDNANRLQFNPGADRLGVVYHHQLAPLSKAGPFIGPNGGKWADPAHKIPWKEPLKAVGGAGASMKHASAAEMHGNAARRAKTKAGVAAHTAAEAAHRAAAAATGNYADPVKYKQLAATAKAASEAAYLTRSDADRDDTLSKGGGPFIGPHGGKWADAKHTVAWKEPGSGKQDREAAAHHREQANSHDRSASALAARGESPALVHAHGAAAKAHMDAAEAHLRGGANADDQTRAAEKASAGVHAARGGMAKAPADATDPSVAAWAATQKTGGVNFHQYQRDLADVHTAAATAHRYAAMRTDDKKDASAHWAASEAHTSAAAHHLPLKTPNPKGAGANPYSFGTHFFPGTAP